MRLDKFLADCGIGSRKDVKDIIKKKRITINGTVITDPGFSVSEDSDQIAIDGDDISYNRYSYIMLNKPAGVITATTDRKDKTVLDLIAPPVPRDLAPVGRLDKDTVGLLLLTNDGALSHRLLSPKSHVPKTYYARVKERDRLPDETDIKAFKEGIKLSDHDCLPADLEIISENEIRLTIYEGKFHQVKRMCASRGFEVIFLKRETMGDLVLDPTLAEGSYRNLTEKELLSLTDSHN